MLRLGLSSLCFFALATGAAQAGVLRVGEPAVENQLYTFPILLHEDEGQVAAMDFRLRYDPAVFRPITAVSGAAAAQANKVVTGNAPLPGEYIVVMMGLNAATVGSGEIAHVQFERIGGTESGETDIFLGDTTLATVEGLELPSQSLGSRIRLDPEQERPEENDSEPEEEDPEPPGGSEESGADTIHIGPALTEEEDNAATPGGNRPLDLPLGGRSKPLPGGGRKIAEDSSRERVDKLASDAAKLRQEVRTPTQPAAEGVGFPDKPRTGIQSDSLTPGQGERTSGKKVDVPALAGTATVERERRESTGADEGIALTAPQPGERRGLSRFWVGAAAMLIVMGLAGSLILRRVFLH